MDAIVKVVDKVLAWTLIVFVSGIVIDVTWQVFTRFIMDDPSSMTEEIANFLLIWTSLLGSAYALRVKAHLGIDILTSKFNEKKQLKWEFVIYTFVIFFAALVLVWGGSRLVGITLKLNQVSAALQLKMGYVYMILPITGLLIIFYSIYFMVEASRKLKAEVAT
ncbi:MAG: TRAP transporter small permease [Lentisphaeraceae bacterium]|nr:TRAP transporter small permease [Lentisphaeraceae bacterium]